MISFLSHPLFIISTFLEVGLHTKGICVPLLLGGAIYWCQLCQVGWWCTGLLCPYKFSTCSIVYREKSVQVSSFNCDCVNVFFNFYHLLLHVFWSTLIRYIHIYNCYVFLIKLPLYRCRVSLYLLIFLVLKPTLSGNKIDTLPFFWLIFTWHIFFHPFIFPLCIFVFKIGFCIQHIVGSCIFFLQY